jgi:hypothetical protein
VYEGFPSWTRADPIICCPTNDFSEGESRRRGGTLDRGGRLCSAKVDNDQGASGSAPCPFPDAGAITTLNDRFGCRIFVPHYASC